MRAVRIAVSYAVYPLTMAAALGWGVVASARGWSPALAVAGATAAAVVLLLALERLLPFAPEWQRPRGDLRTDLLHAIVTGAAVELFRAAALAALATAAVWVSAEVGAPLWPRRWPVAAQIVLATLVAELGAYVAHRVQHETRLWRFHAVHHSAKRLYWLNAQRVHPGDHLFTMALAMAPLALLGADVRVLLPYATCATVHMLFQHANVDARLGPLNWLFSANEVHRWHHVGTARMNCNYGAMLLVWDVVFGTRYAPADRSFLPADVDGIPDYPAGYLAQLAFPFRRLAKRAPT